MPFTFEKTPLDGVVVVTPRVFPDGRGFFMETYKRSEFAKAGIDVEFIQDNHSSSSKGVVRGLHYQKAPYAQAKLIRVSRGAVFDVVVDIRKGSSTYGQWFGVELSEGSRKMLYVPVGFAHGFAALSDDVEMQYKVTVEYCREAEAGIAWDDPAVGVRWPFGNPTLSEKDTVLPSLERADNNFVCQP